MSWQDHFSLDMGKDGRVVYAPLCVKIFTLTPNIKEPEQEKVTKSIVQPGPDALIPRVVRIGELLDLYGDLLTEKQREFMKLHYADDLSLGEIAREYHVSRQAVHDAVKHAERTLEYYEAHLGYLAHGNRQPALIRNAHVPGQERLEQTKQIIRDMKKSLQKKGIVYNVDWIVKDLDRILRLIG